MKHTVRPFVAGDRAFVFDSWIKSFRQTMEDFPEQTYCERMQARITRLLDRGSLIVIATWAQDEDYIAGWCCFGPGPGVVHYVYVRDIERKRGTARDLVRRALYATGSKTVYATHWTPTTEQIARNHSELKYEPSHMELR